MDVVRPIARTALVAVAVTVAEVAWALFCAESGANIFLFYAGIVLGCLLFFVPGVAEGRGGPPPHEPKG